MDEIEFEHTADACTVGELRRAIAGIPAATPLRFNLAEDRRGTVSGGEQVGYAAGFGTVQRGSTTVALGTDGAGPEFSLILDYPSGRNRWPSR